MQRMHIIRYLVLVLVSAFAWPMVVGAQQADPLPWEIEGGYDGVAKAGAWFPVTITVANDGPDVAGTLSVQQTGSPDTIYRQAVDLPHGANKRVVIPVRADVDQSGDVRYNVVLRNGNTAAKQERVEVRYASPDEITTGVLSDDGAALPSYAGLARAQGAPSGRLVRLAPDALPDRPELLQTFDVIFVHAANTASMTEAQRDALRLWVIDGGQLVVGGNAQVAQGLGDLLPAAVNGDGGTSSMGSLLDITGQNFADPQFTAPIVRLEPKPGTDVVRGDNDAPIMVRQALGSGAVVQTAFDLQTLSDAGPVTELWQRVLFTTWFTPSFVAQQQNWWALQNVLDLPSLALPSVVGLVLFLLLYIAAVGPFNYLLLRRLRRREWAYLSVPALVLLFSGGAYAWGAAGRGGETISNQVSFVRVLPNAAKGQATTYMFFYSPTRREYDLSVPATTFLTNSVAPWEQSPSTLDVVANGDRNEVNNFLIDVGGVRSVVANSVVDAPLVEATVRTVDGTQQVVVRNRSNQDVTDLLLVRSDGHTVAVGTLAGGEEKMLQADWRTGFPGAAAPTSNGAIKRDEVLNSMASAFIAWGTEAERNGVFPGGAGGPAPFMAAEAMPLLPTTEQDADLSDGLNTAADLQDLTNQRMYLLGWQGEGRVEAQLNGAPVGRNGETLFYWTVREEE